MANTEQELENAQKLTLEDGRFTTSQWLSKQYKQTMSTLFTSCLIQHYVLKPLTCQTEQNDIM